MPARSNFPRSELLQKVALYEPNTETSRLQDIGVQGVFMNVLSLFSNDRRVKSRVLQSILWQQEGGDRRKFGMSGSNY